ncbi:MAG: hypothetical protein ACOY17_11165, partial [Pseudomonadota bacterium]
HRKDNLSASVLCPGLVATNIATSTRNRQDKYGGASRPSDRGISATELAKGLNPDAVGRQVLEAILDGQFYIFTDPSLRHIIETRSKRILQGYDWAANCKALKGEKQAGPLPGGLLTK